MRLIMLVPLPLAICSDLISFFTFQISTFLSELSSLAVDILSMYQRADPLDSSALQITGISH